MSEPSTEDRLSAYASRSKAAVGGALAMASFASADVVHHQLDTTFNLVQGEQGTLSLQGSGLYKSTSSYTYGLFNVVLAFDWNSSGIYAEEVSASFELGFFHFDFLGFESSHGTGHSHENLRTFGSGHVIGSSTHDYVPGGLITPPSETGLFFLGIRIRQKSSEWHGFIAVDLVSSTELQIDHWAIQTEHHSIITTTLPSDGDPVPGIGGIAALALGASGVRRSRRRPI